MMRAVWGQRCRPASSCAQSARHHAYRKQDALNGFIIRPVTFNDAFGVFLAPFLTAATFINLSWKEKQKKDWEYKFAEIDREIEKLRAREAEALNRIRGTSAARQTSRLVRRAFTTAATAPAIETIAETTVEEKPVDIRHSPGLGETSTVDQILAHARAKMTTDSLTAQSVYDSIPQAVLQLEQVTATKLALELLVQMRLTDLSSHSDLASNSANSDSLVQQCPNLLDQVEAVTKLQMAARKKARGYQHFIGWSHSEASHQMSKRFWEISSRCEEGKISSTQLVEEISQLLVNAPEPPTMGLYTQILSLFHKYNLPSFAALVLATVRTSRLLITEPDFDRILEHIGHCRDVSGFDWCLHEITKVQSRVKLSQSWEMWRVNGERVPVPSSAHPSLVNALAFAALSLGQPSRAEAWACILRRERGGHRADMIKEFLYYYTKSFDWDRGRRWIQEVPQALGFADKPASQSFRDFQTLIFRMLAICVACSKRAEYSEILKAAIDAHFHPPDIDTESGGMNNEQTKAIIFDWSWVIDNHTYDREYTDEHKIARFQDSLRLSAICRDVALMESTMAAHAQATSEETKALIDDLMTQVQDLAKRLDEQIQIFWRLQAVLDSQERMTHVDSRTLQDQQHQIDALHRLLAGKVSSSADERFEHPLAASKQKEPVKQLESRVAELTSFLESQNGSETQKVAPPTHQIDSVDTPTEISNDFIWQQKQEIDHPMSPDPGHDSDSGYSSDSSNDRASIKTSTAPSKFERRVKNGQFFRKVQRTHDSEEKGKNGQIFRKV